MSTLTELFSPDLISSTAKDSFPEGYTVRPLRKADYTKGFLKCFAVLTDVGRVTEAQFNERYDWIIEKGKGIQYHVVIEQGGYIVGTGAMIVERKFIHNLGMIGHIEEIAIAKEYQGKGLGLKLLQVLKSIATNIGCYKTILGTSEANEPFYVKCGYEKSGHVMAQYYEELKAAFERG